MEIENGSAMKIAAPPDLQPTLVGETILIRPLRSEDWAEMFAAASDPLIWEVHPAKDRYK
jgi:N-acetyltransferase